MATVGKIISVNIEEEFRKISTEPYAKYTDVSNQISPPGIDSSPVEEDQGVSIIIDGNAGKSVLVGVYPDLLAEKGETRIYSRDGDGVQVAEIFLKNDGTIIIESDKAVIVNSVDPMELNGNTDFAVRYSELETAFDQLKSDHDDLVSAFNAHVHATAAVGPPVPPTPSPPLIPASSSTADITDSKVEEVLLP